MKKKSESGTARNHRASRKQVTDGQSSGKRKPKTAAGGKAADWIDLDAELRRAKRDFRVGLPERP